jgi:hypothetical protein
MICFRNPGKASDMSNEYTLTLSAVVLGKNGETLVQREIAEGGSTWIEMIFALVDPTFEGYIENVSVTPQMARLIATKGTFGHGDVGKNIDAFVSDCNAAVHGSPEDVFVNGRLVDRIIRDLPAEQIAARIPYAFLFLDL